MIPLRFAHPELVHLIALFPALAALALLLYARRRREAADALGEPGLVRRLAGGDLGRLSRARAALLVAGAAALGVAAAGPVWGTERVPRQAGATDLVLVLDASNSMLVRDVVPNRLERQRDLARGVLRELPDARVGLVVFAGRGYVVTPLTSDRAALELYLDALGPDVVTQGGSSLSDAVRQATELLLGSPDARSRGAALLVSDGEALEEREAVLAAAQDAARAGVTVHTVGVGTRRGGPVPDVIFGIDQERGYKRGPDGTVAVSRLDEELLREVARRTGGTYRREGRPRTLAAAVSAGKGDGPSRAATGYAAGNRYEWFVALALLLLAVDAVAERGRRRRPGTVGGAA
ncbi:MAG TPA: VWA domain-containing protein [Longimicrobiaceae bacterium]|nr:VWA domain-containing protein [Longimicrobiaceae bacterium]